MSLDLSSVVAESDDKSHAFRMGIDAEKTAQLLEGLAAQLRAGVVHPVKARVSSEFTGDDWERGILVFEFNEKVIV